MSQTGMLGNRAEKLAARYLAKQGFTLIEKNYNCRFGEIDLVMQHGEYLVFVEVRYRKNADFGGALESIDQRKQSKLRRSAEYYLLRHKSGDCACRFDILCLEGNLLKPSYNWIQNAF